jgi:hypothetical protein
MEATPMKTCSECGREVLEAPRRQLAQEIARCPWGQLREDAELMAQRKCLEQEVRTRRLGCSNRMIRSEAAAHRL